MTVGNGRSETNGTNGTNGLKEPLLQQEKIHEREPPSPVAEVTAFEKAGFFSGVWFLWLSPFLKIGGTRTLEPGDVPELAGGDRAQELYQRFDTEWQKLERKPNSLRNALIKTFGWKLAQCGILALIKVSVAYVGPALIASFMNVVAGNQRFPYEGYVLVCVLIVAKIVEATNIHLLSFHSQLLGMQVRSAIISVVYRKSLRLSSSARESYGAGQIVNLMSVDAENMAAVCMWLHYIWAVPLQLCVAGFIVYPVLGLGSVAGFVALLVSGVFSYIFVSLCRQYLNKYMKFRDVRVQALVESLNNMKIIKLQAWDGKFYDKVADARGLEFGQLVNYTMAVALAVLASWVAPIVSCLAAFSFAVYLGQTISASAAFTTITIGRSFQELLRLFPNLAFTLAQSLVSLARLERYLLSVELEADAVERLPLGSSYSAVSVENGSFKWDGDAHAPILHNINVDIDRGSLVFVVGKVGAGKSSFLSALQGEMFKISGKVTTCGSTACVAQTAWIQNATIRENILFGRPLDEERYELVLERCALYPDLAQMTFGDQTEIGERGLNLSGGQKQRIQLARALYQDCDIYLLDDVFSAVDAHTGSHLFKECVLTALAEKTVLLVTHQVEFLPKADLVLVLRDGQIVQAGKYEELLGKGTDLEALVLAHREALEKVDGREENGKEQNQGYEDFTRLSTGHGSKANGNSEAGARRDAQDINEDGTDGKGREGEVARLVEDEHKESGRVSFRVYWKYMTRVAYGLLVLAMVILLAIGQVAQIGGDYWVSMSANYQEGDYAQALNFIFVYAAFCFLNLFFMGARPILSGIVGLLASQSYFFGFLRSVFRAPMSFFDITPTGRILSRATTDQGVVDWFIPNIAFAFIAGAIQLIGSLVVTGLTVWPVLVTVIPLFLFVRNTQRHYLRSSRELTRMDGLTKAPMINHFSETISGFSTIRCFKEQERFIETNIQRINANFKMDFHNYSCMEWLGVRLELAGACYIASTALLLIMAPSGLLAPEKVGLALTYSLTLNLVIYSIAWFSCSLENKMISVERLQQFSELPSEAEVHRKDSELPLDWPITGSIELENLKLRYRPTLPLVLKGISLKIRGGEKVGVVGRTGSGKSTLILALFRLVESSGGRILIDGIDISTIGLHDLRSRLSIIPQDPTLFDGTVRNNLDPLEQHSDDEIWQALEKCQLSTAVSQLENKLDSIVTANGENWSVGQRQLFCLGRILLRKSRILVLDEATSSVDTETDAVMQKILRQDFADCTVISIAHRIPSVMDSDKVLVLNGGIVKEFDSPSALLEQPASLFSALVAEYSARAET